MCHIYIHTVCDIAKKQYGRRVLHGLWSQLHGWLTYLEYGYACNYHSYSIFVTLPKQCILVW